MNFRWEGWGIYQAYSSIFKMNSSKRCKFPAVNLLMLIASYSDVFVLLLGTIKESTFKTSLNYKVSKYFSMLIVIKSLEKNLSISPIFALLNHMNTYCQNFYFKIRRVHVKISDESMSQKTIGHISKID